MRGWVRLLIGAWALSCAVGAQADSADFAQQPEGRRELAPYLQCVPYARERSGVEIYGDARTWWDQAAGRYRRGHSPRRGAVMAFRPSGSMVLGHVAAVSRVIDSRTVLLDHANWSPIDGRRGQVERGVKAVDVSPANDWSQVRVWYAPLGQLGTTAWPVAGFIYNEREDGGSTTRVVLANGGRQSPTPSAAPISPIPSKRFAQAFAGWDAPSATAAATAPKRRLAAAMTVRKSQKASRPADPIDAALARYER